MSTRVQGMLCLAVLLLGGAVAAQAQVKNTDHVVAIGDSLTDTGSLFAWTQTRVPFAVPPAPEYFAGRFSNGPVWLETFALLLGYPAADVEPALLGAGRGNNFAIGGARTNSHPDPTWGAQLSCLAQVQAYVRRGPLPDALHVVWCGSNDVRDAIAATILVSPAAGQAIVQTAAANVALMVEQLAKAGARRFVVPSAPNVGLTPLVRSVELALPGITALAGELSRQFNALLAQQLDQLEKRRKPHLDIVRFDSAALAALVVTQPARFGFTGDTTACYTGDVVTFLFLGLVCPEPDTHVFYDGEHPTQGVHHLMGTGAACAASPSFAARHQALCAALE